MQRRAIAAKPDFYEAHSNLGNALHALKRFDEAVVAYRHAIELNPNYADAWANLGTTPASCRRVRQGGGKTSPSRSRRGTPTRIRASASCC